MIVVLASEGYPDEPKTGRPGHVGRLVIANAKELAAGFGPLKAPDRDWDRLLCYDIKEK